MGLSLRDLFPELLDGARELYDTFALVSVVVLFSGLVLASYRGAMGNLSELAGGLTKVAVLVLIIGSFPDWVDEFQLLSKSILEELDANPSEAHTRFGELILGDEATEDTDFWDILWSDEGGVGKAIIYAFVLLFGKVALMVMWLAYLIQGFVLIYGISVSPVFIAMLVWNATRGIAVRFYLSLLSVCVWPVGWALASKFTDALLDLVVGERIYSVDGNLVTDGVSTIIAIVLIGIWMLVSTIAMPRLISQMIQNGSQIGAAMLGSVGGATSRGIGYGVGGGVAASLAGAGAGGTAAAALAGGTSGIVSSAAGTSGAMGSATIGAVAAIGMGSSEGADVNRRAAEIARENRS